LFEEKLIFVKFIFENHEFNVLKFPEGFRLNVILFIVAVGGVFEFLNSVLTEKL
jgi:hypothetical protein